MLTTLLLCFLVAFTAAEQQNQNGAWKTNVEYRFNVQTQTLTAIPNLKNQWVGLLTKADLTIRPVSKDVLYGKIQNGQYREWHDASPEGSAYQSGNKNSFQPMDVNTNPFEIRLNQGVIHSIAVDKDMTNVELNQLKSILSQLQVDIEARNFLYSPRSHLPENNYNDDNDSQALYKVMEPTITGKCESVYDISRVPMYLAQTYTESNSNIPLQKDEHFYEIYKTKNYSHCDQRMGYHFGINGLNDWKPNTNVMGSLTKSSVSRIVISGAFDKYTIRSSVTTNRIAKINPEKETQHDSVVVSQVNLTLASMEETNAQPQIPTERLIDVGNLVYSYNLPSDAKNAFRPKSDSSEENDDYNDDEANQWSNSWQSNGNQNGRQNNANSMNNDHQKSYSNVQSRPSFSFRPRRSVDGNSQRNRHSNNPRYNPEALYESASDENDAYEYQQQFYQPKPTLQYAPENPMINIFIGNKGRSIQNMNQFNGPIEVQKLTEEITYDLDNVNELPKKNTLRKFNVLAKVVRTMDKEQIEETTKYFEKGIEEQKYGADRSRQVYRDALVSAGTGPAIAEIMRWVEQHKVRGEEAAELIASFPKTIREPTEEMQNRFFEFVKHIAVRKQPNVNTTAGIAFTRFMHQAQVNNRTSAKYYPVETYGRLSDRNSKFVSQQVIPYFAQLLENAVKQNDVPSSLYAIRSLGNLGHQEIPNVFEPYLMGKERVSDFQRLSMVLALDKYIESYQHSGPIVPYEIYLNKGETSEIRTAAVFLIVRSRPIPTTLQRLAEQTNTEENKDVKAAVRSILESVARLTNPENVVYAQHARNALNLLAPETEGFQYSRTHLRDYAIREMDASYNQEASYIVNKDSFIPNGIFVDSVGDLGGFKRKAEFQAIVSSIEDLVNEFNDNVQSWQSTNKKSDNNRYANNYDDDEMNSNSNWSAEKIVKLLNMKPNNAKPIEAQFWFNIFNTERFFAFDKNTFENIPQKASKLAKRLRQGVDLKYTKLFNHEDLTISFPLETGLPFTFTYRTPALVQVNGRVLALTTPDVVDVSQNYLRVPESVNVTAKIDAVYSVLSEVTVSFINPSTRQRYSAGYDKKVQMNIPVLVQSNIDIRNREIQTEFKPLHPDQPTKFLQMGSWPFTARDEFLKLRPLPESKHTKDIVAKAPRDTKYTFGEKATGFQFVFEGTQEKDSNQITNVVKALYKHDFTSFALFGQDNASPQHYSLNVILDPKRSTSKSTKFTVKYDNDEKSSGQSKPRAHPRSRGQSADGTENLAVPVSTEPNNQARREQFLRNAADGMPATNGARVLDVSVEFNGLQDLEYVGTVSVASSKSEGKSRLLMFAQKSTKSQQNNKGTKGVYLQVDAKYHTVEQLRQSNRNQNQAYADVDFKMSYALDNSLELGKIQGNVQMKQSPELRQYMQEQARINSFEQTLYQNNVDSINVELDVSGFPVETVEKEVGVKPSTVYNYVRYNTLSYSDENTEYNGQDGKISFVVSLANEMTSANFTLKTPQMKTVWQGVPVPKFAKNLAVVPINWNIFEELKREVTQYRDNCVIVGNEINTFDNRTVEHAQFGNTWHLAAHKMREPVEGENNQKLTHYVSVLVRDAQHGSQGNNNQMYNNYQNGNHMNGQNKNKEVLVVLHQKAEKDITLRLSPGNQGSSTPSVYVDEQEQQVTSTQTTEIFSNNNQNEVLARVYVMEEYPNKVQNVNAVRVETKLGNMEVTFDGKNVQIRSKGFYRNNRGVCGAFTGQSINEMKSPDHRIINNDRDFVASWAVIENNSNQEAKNMQRLVNQKSYPKEEVMYGSPVPHSQKAQKSNNQQNNDEQNYNNQQNNSQRKSNNQQNNNQRKSNNQQNNNEQNSMNWQEGNVDDNNAGSQSNKNVRGGTKHQTQFVEDFENHRICFSKRPLPVCPSGTKPNGKTIQKVQVYCRGINDPAALLYKEQIKRGRSVDMANHDSNAEIKFSVPKRCQPL